jgi:ribonuclease VapC
MIVDSSAIIALLRQEPEADAIAKILVKSRISLIGTPTYLETCMVAVAGREEDTLNDVEDVLTRYNIKQIAFSVEASAVAVQAFLLYGKGRNPRARLNFGDCISYAISKTEAMPLLFKGDDFVHTDVERVL